MEDLLVEVSLVEVLLMEVPSGGGPPDGGQSGPVVDTEAWGPSEPPSGWSSLGEESWYWPALEEEAVVVSGEAL